MIDGEKNSPIVSTAPVIIKGICALSYIYTYIHIHIIRMEENPSLPYSVKKCPSEQQKDEIKEKKS